MQHFGIFRQIQLLSIADVGLSDATNQYVYIPYYMFTEYEYYDCPSLANVFNGIISYDNEKYSLDDFADYYESKGIYSVETMYDLSLVHITDNETGYSFVLELFPKQNAVLLQEAEPRAANSARTSDSIKFLSTEDGKEELKDVLRINSGWSLEPREDYVYVWSYDHPYILRYNIIDNSIDKIVKINDSDSKVYYHCTFSNDGKTSISEAQEWDSGRVIARYLIDFDSQRVEFTDDETYENGTNALLPDVVIRELNCLKDYDRFAIDFINIVSIDDERIVAVLPPDTATGKMGYYKFAVIDTKNDEIIQECKLN